MGFTSGLSGINHTQSATVVVRKDGNPTAAVRAVLAALDLPDLAGKKILLKPNLGRLTRNDAGIVTRTPVIAAIVDFFQARGWRNLFLGDSPILGLKIADIYQRTGLDILAKDKGVTLLDFDENPPLTIEIPGGAAIQSLKVCKQFRDFDYVVSIPVMKMHMHTSVSLALKNLKGFIWRAEKVRLHQLPEAAGDEADVKSLDVAIADIARVMCPDLAIVDGTIAQEGMGPAAGSPREVNLVVGSTDYLDADYVAAQLMGLDPDRIHHLRLARRLAGKPVRPSFTADPANYLDWRVALQPPPEKIDVAFPGTEVDARQACSACMSTLLVFLKTYLPKIKLEQLPDHTLRIKVGKEFTGGGEKTLYLGNCAQPDDPNGIFVKGCPPVSSHIFRLLKENGLIDGDFSQTNV